MKIITKLLTLFLLSINIFSQVDYEKLDQYIGKAVNDFEAVGLAVAIVKDSQVVFSKAYGYADIEQQTPLTTKSLFNIASCTKAFISALVAKQVDEGNLKWSGKVVDHIPNFKLSDIWITNQLNMVDILSHRSGLKTFAGDLLWFQTGYSNKEIIERMQYIPIEREFRSEYGYQNNMYMIAGEIVSKSSGMQWYEYLDKEIFDKLDMSTSKASSSQLNEKDDVAYPHLEKKRYPLAVEKPHAAGSIFSNVDEMSNWVKMLLNNGSYNGEQVLSEKVINDMFTPRTILWLGNSMRNAGANFHLYGLGWFMYDYHGQKIIYHDGGMPGYISRTMLVPKENLGLVILTNEINALPQALSLQIVDLFLGNDAVDWAADYLERVNRYKEQDAKRKNEKDENRITATNHSLEQAGYTGKYNDNSYGGASIKLVDDVLVIKFPTEGFESEMEHWHYDTFKIELDDFLPSGYVTFNFNSNGEVTGFKIDLPNPDFHFNDLYFEKID